MQGAACWHSQFLPQKGRALLSSLPTTEARLGALVGCYFSVYSLCSACEAHC